MSGDVIHVDDDDLKSLASRDLNHVWDCVQR